jgi:hypothetical protein
MGNLGSVTCIVDDSLFADSCPQVGNQAWVTWLDNNVPDLTRINNKASLIRQLFSGVSDIPHSE